MVVNHEIKGKAENLKGRVKQAAGAVTGDKETEAEGAVERAAGAAREMAGKAKRKLENAADDVRDSVKKDDDADEDEGLDDTRPPRGGNA